MQGLIQDEGQELWEHSKEIARKFKLQIVETVGTTRIVLKKKGSRTVIKVGYPPHNRAEYAAYKALECSVLGDLLAPCLGVSKEGYALEMQFIKRNNKYAWVADFHEENMRVMRNGDVKIIDYSNLLADMFSRISKTTVQEAIKGILKLNFPKIDVKLSMRNRIISYRDNDVSYEVPVDPQRSGAII